MTDITLNNIGSGYNLNKMNDNFQTIQEVVNEELLHTEGGNNTMEQELDMNSYRVINGYTDLSDPSNLLTVEAADRRYNTKLGNENTSGLGEFRFNSVDQLKAMTDISANTFTDADVAALADSGAVAHTNSYYLNTGVGGSKYQIRSLASYRTEIGDGSWVPDGYVDHYLIGSSEYIVVLVDRGSIDVDSCGAVGDGITDDTAAFQAAVEAATSQVVFTRSYGLYDQIDVNKSFFTVSGVGTGEIVNYLEEVRGTLKSLFYSGGSSVVATTLTAALSAGSAVVTVTDTSAIAVGDLLSFTADFTHRNLSLVVSISGNTITLDRPASNECTSGQNVNLISPIRNTTFRDFHIDFNGSISTPRYGFGVYYRLGHKVVVENVSARDVASKVVQPASSCDGLVSNIRVSRGVDNGGTGGHGYAVRLSVCNDMHVSGVVGERTRHVVDISGGSRNFVRGCFGYKTDNACFLTHGNNCKDNIFKDNISVYSRSPGAYSFSPTSGDTGNVVDGGLVAAGLLLYGLQDDSNIIKNVVCRSEDGWSIISGGSEGGEYKQTYENCTFLIKEAGTLISSGIADTSAKIRFKSCVFTVDHTSAGIANFASKTIPMDLEFDACDINIVNTSTLVVTSPTCSLSIVRCTVTAGDHSSAAPLINTGASSSISCEDTTFNAINSNYWFSVSGPTTLTLHKCKFVNTVAVYRRYTSGNCNIVFGENHMVNSSYGSLSNLGNLSTIGIPDMGLSAVPAGAWADESKILNSNPAAAATSPSFWVRKGGTWYGAGHLSTTIV